MSKLETMEDYNDTKWQICDSCVGHDWFGRQRLDHDFDLTSVRKIVLPCRFWFRMLKVSLTRLKFPLIPSFCLQKARVVLSHLKSKKRKVDISDFIPKQCFEQSYCLQTKICKKWITKVLVDLKNMACGGVLVCGNSVGLRPLSIKVLQKNGYP